MAARRRIRVPVKKRRPRASNPAGHAAPMTPPSNVWKVLREIHQLIDGIDDVLNEGGAA